MIGHCAVVTLLGLVVCFQSVDLASADEIQGPQPQINGSCDEVTECHACVSRPLDCTFCKRGTEVIPECVNRTTTPEKDCDPITDVLKCPNNITTTTTTAKTITTENITGTSTESSTSATTEKTITTENITITPTSSTSSSSSLSTPTTAPSKSAGRRFDAPSFIGGIVLSLGLLAVVYVGFKFYKSRTERNYHTL